MLKRLNQSGFEHLGIILLIVVIGGALTVGARVATNEPEPEFSKPTQATEEPKEQQNLKDLGLANDSVQFKMPEDWTNEGIGCHKDSPAYGQGDYIDSTAITPGEELPTGIEGFGPEHFSIYACVFGNPHDLSPKAWFSDDQRGINNGFPSEKDITKDLTINGYKAYYIKFTAEEHSYDDIFYVVAAKDKIILVTARTYGKSTNPPAEIDFRKFEPAIKDFVYTISVE